ncbi:MAG: PQQ-binding-like beta-propeller repeat protein [Candidatus Hydrogenedentota bacterium]
MRVFIVAAIIATTAIGQSFISQDALLAGHQGDTSAWPMYGGSYGQTRFSPLDQINAGNVAQLKPAWEFHTDVFNIASGYQTTAVVHGGAMYVTTPRVGRDQWVIKLDARTGKETWRSALAQGQTRYCCGANNRGVAIFEDKVYIATLDASLYALKAETGEIAWRAATAKGEEGYSQTCAPLVYDNKVIIGAAGGEYGIRGFLKAFDAHTGALLWTWYTIPSPEEGGWLGTWVETAPGLGLSLNRDIAAEKAAAEKYPDAWQHGGAPIWTTPSLDPELGLVFVTTGNPGPDYDVTVRPGDNLWGDSLCAIRIADGTMAWGFQYCPHDMWDYDGGCPPVLFDTEFEGGPRKVVGLFTKLGVFYLLDRVTGELLKVSEPYVPRQNFFAPLTEEGIVVAPGSAGGTNWSPAAYSPLTKWVYSANIHWPMVMTTKPGLEFVSGGMYQGGNASFSDSAGVEIWGNVCAIDPVTGKIQWQTRTNLPMFSGVLVTAGNVVFAGESDNKFSAWNATTGEHLWSYPTLAGCHAAPSTYHLDGKQYVIIASGGSRYLRRDRDNPPLADTILAFAIDK